MIWLIKPERNYDMNKTDKIYVAGHRGLVGSAIVRNLQSKGYNNIVGRTHKELELTDLRADDRNNLLTVSTADGSVFELAIWKIR